MKEANKAEALAEKKIFQI